MAYNNGTSAGVSDAIKIAAIVIVVILVFLGTSVGGCAAYNNYRVYSAQQAGKAVLAEAESSRQVKVLEAKAAMDSAKDLAQAEVYRAQGVAQANKIVSDGLGGPAGYLEYLKIEAMKETKDQVIYVPTEAGIPITEAGRRASIETDSSK